MREGNSQAAEYIRRIIAGYSLIFADKHVSVAVCHYPRLTAYGADLRVKRRHTRVRRHAAVSVVVDKPRVRQIDLLRELVQP